MPGTVFLSRANVERFSGGGEGETVIHMQIRISVLNVFSQKKIVCVKKCGYMAIFSENRTVVNSYPYIFTIDCVRR